MPNSSSFFKEVLNKPSADACVNSGKYKDGDNCIACPTKYTLRSKTENCIGDISKCCMDDVRMTLPAGTGKYGFYHQEYVKSNNGYNNMILNEQKSTGDPKNISFGKYKQCFNSIATLDGMSNDFIITQNPRLNLNDESDDKYPKTIIERMLKNSHDSRLMRVVSLPFEACTPIAGTNIGLHEEQELSSLGRHPDQQGFNIENKKISSIFVPTFLGILLLLLFMSNKK